MIFNINTMLNKENSGIEHAELQRIKVLRAIKAPFKQIYFQNNPLLHRWTAYYGLHDNEVLNLYDWYQQTTDFKDSKLTPSMIAKSQINAKRVYFKQNNFYADISADGKILWARIRVFDGTERVKLIERFDGFGQLYRADFYDWRGYLSYSQFYNPDNQIDHYVWFDINGKPVITWMLGSRDPKTKVQPILGIIAVDPQGRRRWYANQAQLTAGWFDALNDQYYNEQRPNLFVVDRTARTEFALGEFSQPAITVFHLHNDHRSGMTDDPHSLFNNNYEYNFYNLQKFDFVITATQKQRRDVIKRFKLDPKRVIQIPVGLSAKHPKILMNKRRQHSVLATCRVASEKRVEWMVEGVALAVKEIPDIYLDVYGYIDHRNENAEQKAIDRVVKKYPYVKDHFKLHGYKKDLDDQRDNHQIYLVTSTMEGFNIALMQAQEHGEVGLSVDVDYGPNELVVDQQNGYIVKNPQDLAKRLIALFKNEQQLQKLSDGAYKLSKRYDLEHVSHAWQELLGNAQTVFDMMTKHEWQHDGLEERNEEL